jgi:hypothetical protein
MKTFYVISALLPDSSPLGKLIRHDTEKQAVEHAKSVIEKRSSQGQPDIEFVVLKAVAKVGTEKAPIKVTKVRS